MLGTDMNKENLNRIHHMYVGMYFKTGTPYKIYGTLPGPGFRSVWRYRQKDYLNPECALFQKWGYRDGEKLGERFGSSCVSLRQ